MYLITDFQFQSECSAEMLTPSRRILLENSPLYYPFGNTGAENILKDFNFQLDETKVY